MTEVNVVIRAKNEEQFIRPCLEAVFSQKHVTFDVTLVDNESTDATIKVAKAFPRLQILSLRDYSPGRALNLGAANGHAPIIVFLSAHCVPASDGWLEKLVAPLREGLIPEVAGAYGRQLPVPFSHPQDVRDLLAIFGPEDRIQTSDSFFHNANSAIRRTYWERFPFDEMAQHIEDRIWASKVLEQGSRISYQAEASVFHWNGMHSSSDLKRSVDSIEILKDLGVHSSEIPKFLTSEKYKVLPIVPLSAKGKELGSPEFNSKIRELLLSIPKSSSFLQPLLVVDDASTADTLNAKDMPQVVLTEGEVTVEEALSLGLRAYESLRDPPDFVLYLNPEYEGFGPESAEQLLSAGVISGAETVFFGYKEYGHFWAEDSRGWFQVDSSLAPRERRGPTFRALYGLGTLSRSWVIREGKLLGKGIRIIPKESFYFSALGQGRTEILIGSHRQSTADNRQDLRRLTAKN